MAGDLTKRTPGTPLSEAELRQRREAARARWAAAGVAGAVGAAAGAAVVNTAARRRQRQGWAEMRRAQAETVGAEVARHKRVDARMADVRAAAEKKVRSGWPVPLYRQVLAHDVHVARRDLRRLPAENVNPDPAGRPALMPIDQEQAGRIAAKLKGAEQQIAGLEGARPPKRVERAAAEVRVPKAHQRKVKTPLPLNPKVVERAQQRLDLATRILDETIRTGGEWETILHAERDVRRAEARLARARKPKATTKTVEVGAGRSAEDAERTTMRRGARQRVQGVPDDKALAGIRKDLKDRVRSIHYERLWREGRRHGQQLKAAKAAARGRWAASLARMPSRRMRLAAVGLGAVAGALATGAGAYAVRSRMEKSASIPGQFAGLRKFANQAGDPADALFEAGDAAEQTLGERIAAAFRELRDAPAAELLQPGADLIGDLQRKLRHATAPIAEAMARGARTAPAGPEVTLDEPMTLAFSFDARNPRVARYIREYREQRIRELAEEQTDTIREVIYEAALAGTSPDDMARQVRQSIGLTAAQAAQVRSFRAQLEARDPRVFARALRDKRFDRTVARAIEQNQPLAGEQVEKMVDAYARRYLAYRATTIARTEGVGAANNGHVAAMKEWLVENPSFTVVKTWMATKDERTRPDHIALHGQAVTGIDTPFRCVSGDLIRWPGDQEAPARQVINCRCTVSTRIVPRMQSPDLSAYGGSDDA